MGPFRPDFASPHKAKKRRRLRRIRVSIKPHLKSKKRANNSSSRHKKKNKKKVSTLLWAMSSSQKSTMLHGECLRKKLMSLWICAAQENNSLLSKKEKSWEDREAKQADTEPKKLSRKWRSTVALRVVLDRVRSKIEDLKI